MQQHDHHNHRRADEKSAYDMQKTVIDVVQREGIMRILSGTMALHLIFLCTFAAIGLTVAGYIERSWYASAITVPATVYKTDIAGDMISVAASAPDGKPLARTVRNDGKHYQKGDALTISYQPGNEADIRITDMRKGNVMFTLGLGLGGAVLALVFIVRLMMRRKNDRAL